MDSPDCCDPQPAAPPVSQPMRNLRAWNRTERSILDAALRWCHAKDERREIDRTIELVRVLNENGAVEFATPLGEFVVFAAMDQLIFEDVYGEPAQQKKARRAVRSFWEAVPYIPQRVRQRLYRILARTYSLDSDSDYGRGPKGEPSPEMTGFIKLLAQLDSPPRPVEKPYISVATFRRRGGYAFAAAC